MTSISSLFPLGQSGTGVDDCGVDKKVTTPPGKYTEGTLAKDMRLAAKFLKDKEKRESLREADGIGTPATRSAIIEGLKKKGHVKKEGKFLVSTPLGQQLHDISPEDYKDPGKTALWEAALKQVAKGDLSSEKFMGWQKDAIAAQIEAAKSSNIKIDKSVLSKGRKTTPCQTIGCQASGTLTLIDGNNGKFWSCDKRNSSACPSHVRTDKKGVPYLYDEQAERERQQQEGMACAVIGCVDGGTLIKINGAHGQFWACNKKREGACCNTIRTSKEGQPFLYDPTDEPRVEPLSGDGSPCPKCKKGKLATRIIKKEDSPHKGKGFLGCTNRDCGYSDYSTRFDSGGRSSTPQSKVDPLFGDGNACVACAEGVLETRVVTNPQSPAKGKKFLACSKKCGAKPIFEDAILRDPTVVGQRLVPNMNNPRRLPGEGRPCTKCSDPLVTIQIPSDDPKHGGKRFLRCSNPSCNEKIPEHLAMKLY